MSTKSKKTKQNKDWTHKSVRNEMERSIALMVLSNPNLEHEIVNNFLTRNGYTLLNETDADAYLHVVHNIPLSKRKHLELRAKRRLEAEKLYELAQEMRAENKAHTAKVIAEQKMSKLGKVAKKDNQEREQNVDRLLKQVLHKVKADDQQNKKNGSS